MVVVVVELGVVFTRVSDPSLWSHLRFNCGLNHNNITQKILYHPVKNQTLYLQVVKVTRGVHFPQSLPSTEQHTLVE